MVGLLFEVGLLPALPLCAPKHPLFHHTMHYLLLREIPLFDYDRVSCRVAKPSCLALFCSFFVLFFRFRYDQRAEALGKKGMIQTDNM